MKIIGWKYYNHAVVPTCAPHEMPDLAPVRDGRIWSLGGGKLLYSSPAILRALTARKKHPSGMWSRMDHLCSMS